MIHSISNEPGVVCEGCGKEHDQEVARLAILACDAAMLVSVLAQKLTETNISIGTVATTGGGRCGSYLPDLLRYHRKLIFVLAYATQRFIRRDLARHEAHIVESVARAGEGMTVN